MTISVETPLVLVRRTADLLLPTGDNTAVTWATADYDFTTPYWDLAHHSRILVPVDQPAGTYLFRAEGRFHCTNSPTDVTQRRLGFRLNGVVSPQVGRFTTPSIVLPSGTDTDVVTSATVHLVAGDYVELVARQDSGGDGTLINGTRMFMVLLAPDV